MSNNQNDAIKGESQDNTKPVEELSSDELTTEELDAIAGGDGTHTPPPILQSDTNKKVISNFRV